jgi:hypothetical protein
MNYLWNLLEAVSQLGNALLGGHPNITMSANAYLRRHHWPWRYKVLNALFFWQEDHCKLSWESDLAFARETLRKLEMEGSP